MKRNDAQMRQEKTEAEKKKLSKILQNSHKKPLSRRDFISLGLMAGGASVLAPSILGLFSTKVYADALNCPASAQIGSSLAPFFVIDFAGGAPLGQEIMVGGRGGQLDLIPGPSGDNSKAYDNFAVPSSMNYYASGISPNSDLGLRFHPSSALLSGIKLGLNNDASLFPSIDGGVIASVWNSDTATNQGNPIHYLNDFGRGGLVLPTIGTRGSDSGGNSDAAAGSVRANTKPVSIATQSDALNVLNGGNLPALLGKDRAQKIRNAIANMSASKLDAFNNLATNEQITTLIKCGYIRASDLPNKTDGATFFSSDAANLTSAFGNTTSQDAVISRLVFSGAAGAATITANGCDQHDGTATAMRERLRQIGVQIGNIIRYASLIQKPVFFALITDGSMGVSTPDLTKETANDVITNGLITKANNGGFLAHPGDNDSVTTVAMLAYVPGKKRGDLIRQEGRQVGAFTSAGVDKTYLQTASSPTVTAQALIYNYLLLHGIEDQISKISPAAISPFVGSSASLYGIFKKAIG